MKNNSKSNNNNSKTNSNGFLPNSLKFISSCIKTASSGVRSAAASISRDNHGHKDQVLWASFDRLELGPNSFKRVLLLGYSNGFQVIDVEDASDVIALVSRHDDPVTFLQTQPLPEKREGREGFRASHPLLLVVACDESKSLGSLHTGRDGFVRDGFNESQIGNVSITPTTVRFYSLRSHNYVHVLRFRSTVYMVRCCPHIVAVGLSSQIYCFDALSLENKFSVLTYPVPRLGSQGLGGVNIGYGPMAVGPRWLAYASDNPLMSNAGRLSPQSITPPLGVSPSTSPGNGSLVARYAMESSKHLAAGLINLGDMGYKTLSRYCQDFIPDGSSSPVYPNSSWKVNRGASHDTDNAGVVVVKDFVSRAVISQFKAHTSPISALCFDPSGTLLVTASIHGNNINIFRIMPSSSQSGSGAKCHDWSSSHVHLYKLHRGFTSAVIQDICFSHYSQWVAITSSHGTCHIFVLSPFGGENVLQIHISHIDGPRLVPALSLPWWSTPSFTVNQQSFSASPPPPVTLSVVSRIKSNSSWLNTVSNAASSVSKKTSAQSVATAAVFHSCLPQNSQSKNVNADALEHILVYTPCGHLVQYKLLSSVGGETSGQEEELRLNFESVQWWDVCRTADWPEREECILGITLGRKEITETSMETSDCEDNDGGKMESLKAAHKHLYLSNAEVHMSQWRIPIWQKSKMYFYVISHPKQPTNEYVMKDHPDGEFEIEKASVQEVEIRRKDLLPVFDHFHRTVSNWNESERQSGSLVTDVHEVKEFGDTVMLPSKLLSTGSATNSDGSSTKYYPLILKSDKTTVNESIVFPLHSPVPYKISNSRESSRFSPEDTNSMDSNISSLTSGSFSAGRTIAKEIKSSNSGVTSEASNTSSNRSDLSMNIIDEGPPSGSLDFEQLFQEGYCEVSILDEKLEKTQVYFADNCCSPCDMEKDDEDGMLGGVFDFSEEG